MTRLLFDFSDPHHIALWRPVNDVIMGGVSRGEIRQITSDTAVFSGNVSFERGGGFASVRTVPGTYDLGAFSGIGLVIKGDGHTYKCNLTDGRSGDDVLHQARFATVPGVHFTVLLPFHSFSPVFRGRPVSDHPALEARGIRTFGLMISDKQTGPFSLEVSKLFASGE